MSGAELTGRREFPSRYNALPGIPTQNLSGTRMMTPKDVTTSHSQDSRSRTERLDPDDRLRQVETRVMIAERSNQVLSEEVGRTRAQLTSQIQRAVEAEKTEQSARQLMENSVKTSRDIIVQLANRVQRVEEKRQEDRGFMSAVASQLKAVEQQSLSLQKDLFTRRELQSDRLEDAMTQLNDAVRREERLERMVSEMTNELQQMRARMDSQSMSFVMTTKELNSKSQRLEEENKYAVENIQKANETQSQTEQATTHLRSLIEQRLVEVRDAVVDLQSKQDLQEREQRATERRFLSRLSELQMFIGEQNRKRDESLVAAELSQRNRDHTIDMKITELHSRLTESSEELNGRMAQRETILREESQGRHARLEMVLMAEGETRERTNGTLKDDLDFQIENLRKSQNETTELTKELHVSEKRRLGEALHKLNEAVNLVEKQLEEYQKHQGRLFAAEIQSRMLMEQNLASKVSNGEERFLMAVKQLREESLAAQQSRVSEDLLDEMRTNQDAQMRTIAELQKTVASVRASSDPLGQRIEDLRTDLQEEIKQRDDDLKHLREMMSGRNMAEERGTTTKTLKELQDGVRHLSQAVESLRRDVASKLETELNKLSEMHDMIENQKKNVNTQGIEDGKDNGKAEGINGTDEEKKEEEEKEEEEKQSRKAKEETETEEEEEEHSGKRKGEEEEEEEEELQDEEEKMEKREKEDADVKGNKKLSRKKIGSGEEEVDEEEEESLEKERRRRGKDEDKEDNQDD